MGTRQTRLLSPTAAALAGLNGQLVQLILTDGEVLRGTLEAGPTGDVRMRPSRRGPLRAVSLAAIRELFSDLDANQ